jgi:hypothetical protein
MDWGLEVARGEVQRAAALNRFAFIPTISGDYETVWELGDTYEYPTTAVPMTVTSDAAGTDETVEVTVTGLDSQWRTLTETVVLNASGTATTNGLFLRINSARITNGVAVVGNISITNGGVTYSYIDAEYGKSLSSVYTVPEGYAAYILSGDLSIGKQKEVIAKLMIRQFDGIFTAEGIIGSSGAPYQKEWRIPLYVPAKSDIEVRAKASATTEVASAFEILLVEQD